MTELSEDGYMNTVSESMVLTPPPSISHMRTMNLAYYLTCDRDALAKLISTFGRQSFFVTWSPINFMCRAWLTGRSSLLKALFVMTFDLCYFPIESSFILDYEAGPLSNHRRASASQAHGTLYTVLVSRKYYRNNQLFDWHSSEISGLTSRLLIEVYPICELALNLWCSLPLWIKPCYFLLRKLLTISPQRR